MSVKISHLKGAFKVKAEIGDNQFISGKENFDSNYIGLLPSDLLELSLGLCQGLELAAYLNKRFSVDEKGFTLEIHAKDNGNFVEFIVDIDLHFELSDFQRRGIERVVEKCGICDIIKRSHKVKINLNDVQL
jgi:uncharacterized OsmC-like protein